MNFPAAVKSGFRNYTIFSGRASRSEFWWFLLFCFVSDLIPFLLDAALFQRGDYGISIDGVWVLRDFGPLSLLWLMITLIPFVSVTVRRLHDRDRSGWWVLTWPITSIFLLYYFTKIGTVGDNRFGPDPLAASAKA